MNPFVNPKKRSISLPAGCKDLVDVLQLPRPEDPDPVKRFILLVLMDAQQEHAAEVVIGAQPTYGECPQIADIDRHVFAAGYIPVWYKVGNTVRGSAFPSDIRSLVVAELERMAGLTGSPFPKEGIFSMRLEETHLKWRVRMTSPDAECILTRIED